MEADPSPDGFKIENAKIPILLALRPIKGLRPHEETVRLSLDALVALLRRDPVLRHPIIVDEKTGLVLDGTHRLAALVELGCQFAPCALVKYQDSRIRVERWFRKIEGINLGDFKPKLATMTPRQVESAKGEQCLSDRTCYASIEDPDDCLVFSTATRDPVDLACAGYEIEKIARKDRLQVTYEDKKTFPPSNGLVLSTIAVNKLEVIEASSQRRVFPPKTTRHVIPSRPLGIGVSLALLGESDLGEAQQKFLKHLHSRRLVRKPEGSWVGSRRYQEEVFLFE